MRILYLKRFSKRCKKLPKEIQKLTKEKEKLFRKNPFNPMLNTHKLHGLLDGFYAFSIKYNYRVIFEFADEETVRFYDIGTHDIYY